MSSTSFGRNRVAAAALAALGVAGLSACGGSGSDDPATPPAGASVTVSGTAATGLAIAGQTVDAKCKGGIGSATTNGDGTYTVTVEGGASLPCTLRVTMAGGEVLHSLATGTGSTARANITPVSELVVARLAGGDPASFFTGFEGSAADAVTPERVEAAVVAIVETLKSAGIDLSGVGDVLTAELVAATEEGAQGNAFDQALDALKAAVEANGTTLAELAQTVARMSPEAATAPTGVASLPPELLLRRAAADCAHLRDGRYRLVHPLLTDQTRTLELEASTLTFRWADGMTTTWTATEEACKYERSSGFGGVNTMKVSPAGVALMTLQVSNGAHVTAVLFPEQTIPVGELAGEWMSLEWVRDDAPEDFELVSADLRFDAAGNVLGWTDYSGPGLLDATEEPMQGAGLAANRESGGFDGAGELTTVRAFAYRSGSGDLMLVWYDLHGSMGYATKKYARGMPELNQQVGSWSALVNRQGGVMQIGGNDYRTLPKQSYHVTEIVDEDTYVRTDDVTAVAQTLNINDPRTGYVHRVAGASEIAMLGLRGMNLTAFAKLNDFGPAGFFGLAIDMR